jgi:cholest-4-en-3-one 26-monooxygenase
MALDNPTLHTLDITDTSRYVKHGYPWQAWDLLRREAPVYWYQRPRFEPFWAITKHEDIAFISRHPELFSNTQMLRLDTSDNLKIGARARMRNANRYGGSPDDPPDFIFMDPPEHREHRAAVSRHFTPRRMRSLETHFAGLADNYVSRFAEVLVDRLTREGQGGVVDVVHELAAKLPVAAICEMAGIPEEDWGQIFKWTEALVGAGDAEFRRPGEDREQALRRTSGEWRRYNEALVARRLQEGLGADLLSTLIQADVDGQKLSPREISAYFTLLVAAGNETTRNSTTGGIKALLDHPEQLRRLLDEDVFEDPYTFDIGRDPNDHFAFGGFGEHFCLGAHLARWEMRSIFHALLPVLPTIELASEPELVSGSLHVGGIKRMMVRSRQAA